MAAELSNTLFNLFSVGNIINQEIKKKHEHALNKFMEMKIQQDIFSSLGM